MALIYYFDVGNTRAKFWRCQGSQVEASIAVVHKDNISLLAASIPAAFDEKPDAIWGASVLAPAMSAELASAFEIKWGCKPSFARSSASCAGIENAYGEAYAQLGVDRWLGLLGLGPGYQSVCLVSCGTAITCDVLKKNRHIGGYILPGLSLMSDSLIEKTQGIKFSTRAAESFVLGKCTADAVLNGVLLAVVALIERVVKDECVTQLVLTGGDAQRIAAHLKLPYILEPDIILSGLQRYFSCCVAG